MLAQPTHATVGQKRPWAATHAPAEDVEAALQEVAGTRNISAAALKACECDAELVKFADDVRGLYGQAARNVLMAGESHRYVGFLHAFGVSHRYEVKLPGLSPNTFQKYRTTDEAADVVVWFLQEVVPLLRALPAGAPPPSPEVIDLQDTHLEASLASVAMSEPSESSSACDVSEPSESVSECDVSEPSESSSECDVTDESELDAEDDADTVAESEPGDDPDFECQSSSAGSEDADDSGTASLPDSPPAAAPGVDPAPAVQPATGVLGLDGAWKVCDHEGRHIGVAVVVGEFAQEWTHDGATDRFTRREWQVKVTGSAVVLCYPDGQEEEGQLQPTGVIRWDGPCAASWEKKPAPPPPREDTEALGRECKAHGFTAAHATGETIALPSHVSLLVQAMAGDPPGVAMQVLKAENATQKALKFRERKYRCIRRAPDNQGYQARIEFKEGGRSVLVTGGKKRKTQREAASDATWFLQNVMPRHMPSPVAAPPPPPAPPPTRTPAPPSLRIRIQAELARLASWSPKDAMDAEYRAWYATAKNDEELYQATTAWFANEPALEARLREDVLAKKAALEEKLAEYDAALAVVARIEEDVAGLL